MRRSFIRKKLALFVFAALSVVFTCVKAQDAKVTGRVIDVSGTGIPGATVLIKGTPIGSNTDADGRFTIQTRSPKDVLVISFVGYKPVEMTIGSQTSIEIKMESLH